MPARRARFDGLPPRARLMLLAAQPPYRRRETLLLWECFIESGEVALFDLMDLHRQSPPAVLCRYPRTRRAFNALVLAVT